MALVGRMFVWFRWEHLSRLGEVRNIVLSWMRPVAVFTSQFFLSDEGEDVEIPHHINDGRAVLQRKVDFDYVNNYPQFRIFM